MARASLAPLRLSALTLPLILVAGSSAPLAQGAAPQSVPPPVPMEKRGPPLGSVAPAIRLRDQHDREQTLATLAGKDGLVLLFVRSADW